MKDNRKDENFWALLRIVGRMHQENRKKILEEIMKPRKPIKPRAMKARKAMKSLKPLKSRKKRKFT